MVDIEKFALHTSAPFYFRCDAMQYKKYMCVVCGWIYDEELGAPDEGLPAGTLWEDIPDTWVCPDCAAGKEDFEMVEI